MIYTETFDSPGVNEHIFSHYKSQQGIKASKIKLDMMLSKTFLSRVNMVNTCNNHSCDMFALFPEKIEVDELINASINEAIKAYHSKFENMQCVLDSTISAPITENYHKMKIILERFDLETGQPKECKRIVDWPVIKSEAFNDLRSKFLNITEKAYDFVTNNSFTHPFTLPLYLFDKYVLPSQLILRAADIGLRIVNSKIDISQLYACSKDNVIKDEVLPKTPAEKFEELFKSHYKLDDGNYLYQAPKNLHIVEHSEYHDLKLLKNIDLDNVFQGYPKLIKELEELKNHYRIKEYHTFTRMGIIQNDVFYDDERFDSNDSYTMNTLLNKYRKLKTHPAMKNLQWKREEGIQSQDKIKNRFVSSEITVKKEYLPNEKLIAKIRDHLVEKKCLYISGLPGSGKTSLAEYYVQREVETRGALVRIFKASNEAELSRTIKDYASKLGIDLDEIGRGELSTGIILKKVQREMEEKNESVPKYIIFDGIENSLDISDIVHTINNKFKIIITTRDKKFLYNLQEVKMELFDKASAMKYFTDNLEKRNDSLEDIVTLVEAIADSETGSTLPYRLNAITAWLNKCPKKSIDKYIELYKAGKDDNSETELLLKLLINSESFENSWKLLQYCSYLETSFISDKFLMKFMNISEDELDINLDELSALSLITQFKLDGEWGIFLHNIVGETTRRYIINHQKDEDIPTIAVHDIFIYIYNKFKDILKETIIKLNCIEFNIDPYEFKEFNKNLLKNIEVIISERNSNMSLFKHHVKCATTIGHEGKNGLLVNWDKTKEDWKIAIINFSDIQSKYIHILANKTKIIFAEFLNECIHLSCSDEKEHLLLAIYKAQMWIESCITKNDPIINAGLEELNNLVATDLIYIRLMVEKNSFNDSDCDELIFNPNKFPKLSDSYATDLIADFISIMGTSYMRLFVNGYCGVQLPAELFTLESLLIRKKLGDTDKIINICSKLVKFYEDHYDHLNATKYMLEVVHLSRNQNHENKDFFLNYFLNLTETLELIYGILANEEVLKYVYTGLKFKLEDNEFYSNDVIKLQWVFSLYLEQPGFSCLKIANVVLNNIINNITHPKFKDDIINIDKYSKIKNNIIKKIYRDISQKIYTDIPQESLGQAVNLYDKLETLVNDHNFSYITYFKTVEPITIDSKKIIAQINKAKQKLLESGKEELLLMPEDESKILQHEDIYSEIPSIIDIRVAEHSENSIEQYILSHKFENIINKISSLSTDYSLLDPDYILYKNRESIQNNNGLSANQDDQDKNIVKRSEILDEINELIEILLCEPHMILCSPSYLSPRALLQMESLVENYLYTHDQISVNKAIKVMHNLIDNIDILIYHCVDPVAYKKQTLQSLSSSLITTMYIILHKVDFDLTEVYAIHDKLFKVINNDQNLVDSELMSQIESRLDELKIWQEVTQNDREKQLLAPEGEESFSQIGNENDNEEVEALILSNDPESKPEDDASLAGQFEEAA